VIFKGESCLAAIDTKFTAQPKRTKSMVITLQDLKPKMAFYIIPECQVTYNLSDNLMVAAPWQINEIILSL
jgi:hypothetical protein